MKTATHTFHLENGDVFAFTYNEMNHLVRLEGIIESTGWLTWEEFIIEMSRNDDWPYKEIKRLHPEEFV